MEDERRFDQDDSNSHHADEVIGVGRVRHPTVSPRFWALDDAHVALRIDLGVYPLNAVFRAAYKLTDRAYIFVDADEAEPDRACVLFLAVKANSTKADLLVCELANELVDQRLRDQLEERFGDIRTLIVAQAFSEGNLLECTSDGDRDPHTFESGRTK